MRRGPACREIRIQSLVTWGCESEQLLTRLDRLVVAWGGP